MFQTCKIYCKPLAIYLSAVFLIFITYTELSRQWTPIGGTNGHQYYFEIPLLLVLSLLFYFPKIESNLTKYLIPTIPILAVYLCFDVFYNFLQRSLRPSDLDNVNTIFDFSLWLSFSLISVTLVAIISIAFLLHQAYKAYPAKRFAISLLFKMISLIIIVTVLSSETLIRYLEDSYIDIAWSQQGTIRKNGRFVSIIHHGIQEQQNLLKLSKYASPSNTANIQNTLYPGTLKNHQNIHFIVLESFIDPRLLVNVSFNRSPLAPELTPYLHKNHDFSNVISPTYGGGTAQAEFEILTGIKALAKVRSIEFNIMNGSSASSLVNRLRSIGYRTVATIATNSGYFNSPLAYKSLGFEKVHFLEEKPDFKKTNGDSVIFDGDVLNYNLNLIDSMLNKSNEPIFSYVLGMYGHGPYKRNLEKRPDIIEINHKDEQLHRITNQFFYRTKTLAEYINKLVSIDPSAIIYITSDHLPPIIGKKIRYQRDKYTNISLLLNSATPIDTKNKKYFEIPWLIWDLLTKKEHSRPLTDKDMEDIYFRVLAESIASSM